MPKVAGQDAGERLMQSLQHRVGQIVPNGTDMPTEKQVAAVLHALADHTSIMEALKHRPDPTSPWLEATSVGRWFHDVADSLEYKDL